MKLGILMNMDGNCVCVVVAVMCFITATGLDISLSNYIGMALIILLFSVGAPNLPGSFMLGTILLMSFIGISEELIAIVVILEAFMAKFYSFANATGDIISLVIEDERNKRRLKKSHSSEK